MAYSYSVLAPAGAIGVTIPSGSVIRYNGVLLNVLETHNGFNVETSWILYAIDNLHTMSYVEQGASIAADTQNSDIELQSGTAPNYQYGLVANAGDLINFVAGDVFRWGDYEGSPILQAVASGQVGATISNALEPTYFTVLSGVIDVGMGNQALYQRYDADTQSPPPPPPTGNETATTLTSKTIAGFTKAFTLIQEGRTRQLSAEQLLLVVKAAAEAKASINDSDLSATGSTLSASKINDLIVSAKAAVVNQIYGSGVAPESLDQIVEIAQKLTDNDTEFGAFINTLAGKLSFTEAQSLTTEQKTTARANIDAASTGDVTAAITAAVGDPSTIDIDALANSIVTPFPAALPTA